MAITISGDSPNITTLALTTLSDGTNSTSTTNAIQGSAKAWVNFNGSSGAIRASYNVSSVTRASTGAYTVNFTNAFSDANYAFSGSHSSTSAGASSFILGGGSLGAAPTTTAAYIGTYVSAAAADPTYVNASFFR